MIQRAFTIAGVALFLMPFFLGGCSLVSPAYSERPNKLPVSPPTARELEKPVARQSAPPPVPPSEAPQPTRVQEPSASKSEVTSAANGQRPKPPIPPAVPDASPIVDETMTIATKDLHGYAFPGVGEVPAPKVEPFTITEGELRKTGLEPAVEEKTPAAPGKPAPLPAAEPPAAVDSLGPAQARPAAETSEKLTEPPAAPEDQLMTDAEYFAAYRIGPGDVLEFQSYNDTTLNRTLTVRYDGRISLPMVSDIDIADLTREEAERLLREAYSSIFRDPLVSLLVSETASKMYRVVGDIATPGRYPYTGETTLIDAISEAGGLRPRNSSSSVGGFVGITGQLTKAFIIRRINDERKVISYDLRGLGRPGPHPADAPVYYGDLIYVPEGVNLVYVLGESRNPVIVELTEGMTLLQLLALSGGFTASTARLGKVVLMRQIDDYATKVLLMNVRKMLKTGRDFPLNPGDILYIPRKRLVRIQEFVERFTGSISPILNLYTSAVNAYYVKDLAQATLKASKTTTNTTQSAIETLQGLSLTPQTGSSR